LKGKATQIALLTMPDRNAALGVTNLVSIHDTVYGFDMATGQVVTLHLRSSQMSP
jgi:hypothetical protein